MTLDKRELDRHLSQSDSEAHPEWFEDEAVTPGCTRAFSRGMADHRRGKRFRDNPYRQRGLRTQWERGWCDADMAAWDRAKGAKP